jgi:hypothetical protein
MEQSIDLNAADQTHSTASTVCAAMALKSFDIATSAAASPASIS